MKTTKVSPLIQLQHCLQCWLSLHTCNKISNATFADADMKKFVELAQSLSPDFRIVHRGGVPLVVRCHDSYEQIVLPSSGGFQTLALEECHGSSLAGHLGARKTLELLR